jgi:hypothetical protein
MSVLFLRNIVYHAVGHETESVQILFAIVLAAVRSLDYTSIVHDVGVQASGGTFYFASGARDTVRAVFVVF